MRRSVVGLTALCLMAWTCGSALSDGMMMMSEPMARQLRERALINEPEQKAAIIYNNGVERLIISPSYKGKASEFAWVVPVPARPKVSIVKGAVFHELMRITEPPKKRVPSRYQTDGLTASAPGGVRVLERKTVGAYDVSVLESTGSAALMDWLKVNKYVIPSEVRRPMDYYIRNKWTFVACRVKTPGSAKGLGSGTLAPISLTFKSKQLVYPLRLSAANPEPFNLLLYILVPSKWLGPTPTLQQASDDMVSQWRDSTRSVIARPEADQSKYPTLAGMVSGKVRIYKYQRPRTTPDDCAQDMVWSIGR